MRDVAPDPRAPRPNRSRRGPMSISSPQTGGSRRPSSRPAAGAKPARKSTPSPKSAPALVKSGQHQYGHIDYKQSPPVAGPHNYNWQRCQGDVYPEPIANEHAVHALEHGAVWITYRPDLPKSQVDKLAAKVRGNDYLFMSPYPGLDKPISLQAWGYQLKVDNADDGRIGDFIKDLRQNATQEPGAACSTASGNYITSTGTKPHDLGSPAPSAPSS